VKARPGRKLTVWLDATVVQRSQVAVRPAAVEWSTDPMDRMDEPEAGAAPFVRLAHVAGFSVRVSPYDPDFPNLARLLDGPSSGQMSVSTVRYRPGERHVLRFDNGTSEAQFAKLARPGDGQRLVDAATRFADAVNAGGRLAVGPLALMDDAVIYPTTGGRSLSLLNPRRPETLANWMNRTGRAMAQVHQVASTNTTVEHLVKHELAIATRAVQHVGDLAPELRSRVEAIVERLRGALTLTDPVEAVALHGDMKLDHLHRRQDQLLIIDIDRAGHGEAAIDLGNLSADVRWWGRAHAQELVAAATAGVVHGYGDAIAESPRAHLMEAIGLLRIAGRRPQLTSRAWLTETTQVIGVVERLTERLEQDLGVRVVRP
jgi:hypothetical protein